MHHTKNYRSIISGDREGNIILWNIKKHKLLKILGKYRSCVNSLSISPDGKTLASGSGDKKIKLWNLETFAETKTLTGHG